jgi:hypothetical protein
LADSPLAGHIVAGVGNTLSLDTAEGTFLAVGVLLTARRAVHTDAIVVADAGIAIGVRRTLVLANTLSVGTALVARDAVVIDVAGRFVDAGASRGFAGSERAGLVGAGVIRTTARAEEERDHKQGQGSDGTQERFQPV